MSAAPGRPQGSHGVNRQEEDLLAFSDRCAGKGEPAEVFFPPTGKYATRAKELCAGCPVQGECLEYALKYDEMYGIWGGSSRKERVLIKRQRKAAAA